MTTGNSQLNNILKSLDNMQAIDIKAIDVKHQTSVTDYMIVCSGRASRHVAAIGEQLMEDMKKQGLPAFSATGLDTGDWVLIDFGDYVVHIMQPESRLFYNLEGLWQD